MIGQWIGASILLGHPVPVDGLYPHICGISMTGLMTGAQVRTSPRDCAACRLLARPDDTRHTMPDTSEAQAEHLRRIGDAD